MISEKMFEDTMNGVKKQMSEMKEEMSIMMMSMKNEVEEMRKDMKEQKRSVEFMSEFFDDLKKTNESLMNRLSVVEKNNAELAKKNTMIEKQLNSDKNDKFEVEAKFLEIKNEQLQDNLEFVGIDCEKDENCKDLALNIVKRIDPNINTNDIFDAYRIGNPKDVDGKPKKSRPILVKFKERKTRNSVYRNKKKIRTDDQINQARNRIFINENLCKESKDLFRKANVLKKEKKTIDLSGQVMVEFCYEKMRMNKLFVLSVQMIYL